MSSPFLHATEGQESKAIKHILIPFDENVTSSPYIQHGLELAKIVHARVTLLHVKEVIEEDVDAEHKRALLLARKKAADKAICAAKAQAESIHVPHEMVEKEGDAAQTITSFVCDLIVMGSHSRKAAERHTVGSVAESVLQLSTTPVIAIRCSLVPGGASSTTPGGPAAAKRVAPSAQYKEILVSYDGSFLVENALAHVLPLARAMGGRVTLLYVLEVGAATASYVGSRDPVHRTHVQVVESFLRRGREFCEAHHVPCTTSVVESSLHPADAIVQVAARHSLLVLATHGRRGIERRLLGSVAEGVLRLSDTPLFVVGRRNLSKEKGDHAVAANNALSID